MSSWLNMVKGAMNLEDMPWNLSRATLQQNRTPSAIRRNLVKQGLETLDETAEKKDDHDKFDEQFGKCLKPDEFEDTTNCTNIVQLLRRRSSKSNGEQISPEEHIDRMNEDWNDIHCTIGEGIAVVSPWSLLETCCGKGAELLRVIGKYLVRKYLEVLAVFPVRKDDYKQRWEQFGSCPKSGAHTDWTNRMKITELTIEEVDERQKLELPRPLSETYCKKGLEVMYTADSDDECFALQPEEL